MAADPIRVVPYDSEWPAIFGRQAAEFRDALGAVALRIDHIGSTAIPRLVAKPVIDVQISVADFEPLDAYRGPLERLGYVFRADNPDRTKRYFREPPGQRRTHIHVRRAGSFSEQVALLFRHVPKAKACGLVPAPARCWDARNVWPHDTRGCSPAGRGEPERPAHGQGPRTCRPRRLSRLNRGTVVAAVRGSRPDH